MCLNSYVRISPRSKLAPRSVFVGCGKCEECRSAAKSSWCFRLRAEIDSCVSRGFKVVFFTLTYSDESLPRLGLQCFRSDVLARYLELEKDSSSLSGDDLSFYNQINSWRSLPCFSRDDVQSFVHSVREWLWREYDYKSVSYFVACEYGSNTKRPHMHGLMCVPPSVDTDRLHAFILSVWTPKGHVFPRYPQGGLDSHGYRHKPFVVASPASAARYAAKYACKDLYYDEMLSAAGLSDEFLDLKSRAFKRSSCFHVQSRSLGACLLDGLSDSDKLDLIRIGWAFQGDTEFSKIPVYIRNKLIFDNKYIFVKRPMSGERVLGDLSTHTDCNFHRLVTREANAFFKLYARDIFEAKLESYTQLVSDLSKPEMYRSRHVPDSVRDASLSYLSRLDSVGCSPRMAARVFLLYNDVPVSRRVYADTDTSWMVYLGRYCDVDLSMFPSGFPSPFIDLVLDVVRFAIMSYSFTPLRKSEMQRLTERIQDYFGHLT